MYLFIHREFRKFLSPHQPEFYIFFLISCKLTGRFMAHFPFSPPFFFSGSRINILVVCVSVCPAQRGNKMESTDGQTDGRADSSIRERRCGVAAAAAAVAPSPVSKNNVVEHWTKRSFLATLFKRKSLKTNFVQRSCWTLTADVQWFIPINQYINCICIHLGNLQGSAHMATGSVCGQIIVRLL